MRAPTRATISSRLLPGLPCPSLSNHPIGRKGAEAQGASAPFLNTEVPANPQGDPLDPKPPGALYSCLCMNYSLYLHIPFCSHRCAYCDFNTYAGQEDSIPAYVEALCKEIERVGELGRRLGGGGRLKSHTVFFGGGTPSLLSPRQLERILHSIHAHFDLAREAEVSMEANPGTVSLEALRSLREIGINRLSFGVQSANAEELRMLERAHDFFDVIEAVSSARKAGFNNLNLDLIYGLPEQSLPTWQTTLQRVLQFHPEHISAYALTLEHGTPFGRWSVRGLMPAPNPDLAADMYDAATEVLHAAGYTQYEISNWSKAGHACVHNLQYWRALPYLGFGAGAHGYAGGFRYSNVLRIKTYIERVSESQSSRPPQESDSSEFPIGPAAVNLHRQSRQDELSEYMITGLRLTGEGIARSAFQERFGCELSDLYSREVEELIGLGLLEWRKDPVEALCLTRRGRFLSNQVFIRFLP